MSCKSMLSTGARIGFLLVLLLSSARAALCQFSSMSTGSDGALTFTTPGTYVFDPAVLGLDPAGDGIFNFSTINIAKGVTLQIPAIEFMVKPIYWLASGNVTINGTIEINGADGNPPTTVPSLLSPAVGGAGGYAGGIGGNATIGPPAPGAGVGGGVAPTGPANASGANGTFTGNQFLLPFVGGSGGSGGFYGGTGTIGGGGSGGGGALLIASSTSITFGGVINANGGKPGGVGTTYAGGAGSGGAIELIAPVVAEAGNGDSTCASGGALWAGAYRGGSPGTIRIESTHIEVATACVGKGGGDPAGTATYVTSSNMQVILPTNQSMIFITSVAGQVPPTGNSSFPEIYPEFNFGNTSPVAVDVAAAFIPPGTVPQIYVTSLVTGTTQIVPCSALQGSLASSTCSAMVTFPQGGSFGFVKANWSQ